MEVGRRGALAGWEGRWILPRPLFQSRAACDFQVRQKERFLSDGFLDPELFVAMVFEDLDVLKVSVSVGVEELDVGCHFDAFFAKGPPGVDGFLVIYFLPEFLLLWVLCLPLPILDLHPQILLSFFPLLYLCAPLLVPNINDSNNHPNSIHK